MTRLKFYYDLMSQPCRAVYIFLKLNKIPFEPCVVNLRNGEQYTDHFKNQISRFQKVPVLHDKDFKLTENVAIVRYLAREFEIEDRWYPKDSKQQARVDEYLEWQHHNTRTCCSMYFINAYLKPRMTGKPVKSEELMFHKRNMEDALDKIEDLWLGQGHKYLTGDQISYADILGACELEQPIMAGYNPFHGRPNMTAWLERVKMETNPFYKEAHVIVDKVIQKQKQAKI